MPLGETLYEPGGELQHVHVYFPTTAHRVTALYHGVRRLSRNGGGWQGVPSLLLPGVAVETGCFSREPT
jgi:hypothetical protein